MSDTTNYLILFADLIGSTEVAVEVPPSFFARTYLASFHWAVNKALEFVKSKNIFLSVHFRQTIQDCKIIGDEVVSFKPLAPAKTDEDIKDIQDLVASAVAFAYVTKLYWLATPYNLQRMLGKQFPRDIAVGIHIGPAAELPRAKKTPEEMEPLHIAGLHINLAKRIEQGARSGKESRIFASSDVVDLFHDWCNRYTELINDKRPPLLFTGFLTRAEPLSPKGVPKTLQLFELAQDMQEAEHMIALLKLLMETPGSEDIEAEKAARIMSEKFFSLGKNPFQYDDGSKAIEYTLNGTNVDTAECYIAHWFKAIEKPSKLFWDEAWLVLNCYLVSIALIRHPDISKKRLPEYLAIAKDIFDRLQDLLKQKRKK